MGLLQLVVPVVLVALFIWKVRQRPILLSSFPLVLALGRSAFIDVLPTSSLFFFAGQVVSVQDMFFGLLVLGWLIVRRSRPLRPAAVDGWTAWAMVVLGFLAFEVLLGWVDLGRVSPMSAFDAREWFYIPLGLLLMRDTFRHYTKEEVLELLGFLAQATVALTVFYVADAVGAHFYPFEKYQVASFGGTTIVRDFTTLSFWLGLALAYWLARPRMTPLGILALVVLFLGCFFSFTRSTVIVAAAMCSLSVLAYMLKRGRFQHGISIAATSLVLVVGGLVLVSVMAPAQYSFFAERWEGITGPSSAVRTGNVVTRLALFTESWQAGAQKDALMGVGILGSGDTVYRGTSWDSDWITIVYRLGLVGVALLALPLAVALVAAGRSFARTRDTLSATLALTLLLFGIWTLSVRFVGILYLWWFALSLVAVALIAVDSRGQWYKAKVLSSEEQ